MSTSGRVVRLIGITASGCALSVALHAAGVRINLSPSAPLGVFLAAPIGHGRQLNAQLERGRLVAVCLPAAIAQWGRARGYLMRGSCPDGTAPVGKTVFAVSGDTVTVTADGLALGGGQPICRTRALVRDAAGRTIPRVPDGRYEVAAGEIWLVSTYTVRSWDSRYFGPVPTARAVATLRPIWTMTAGRDEPDTTGGRSVPSCSLHTQ